MSRIDDERPGNLLRRGNTCIAEEVAMDSVWVVEVQDCAHKLCTVGGEETEVALVLSVIELLDKSIVLFLTCLEAEAIDCSVV